MNNHSRGGKSEHLCVWEILMRSTGQEKNSQTVTQPTAALSTCSALFIAHVIQQEETENLWGKRGIMAVFSLLYGGFIGLYLAKWGYTHSHMHTKSRQGSLSLCIKNPPHTGIDFCSWHHEKRENFMFISLWFYFYSGFVVGEVRTFVWHFFVFFVRLTHCLSMFAVLKINFKKVIFFLPNVHIIYR